jgi:uncharacterized protein (TIGR01777 family)
MRVAITGSNGLIGSALIASLESDGIEVVRLVRGASWDPEAGTVVPGVLDGVDAVVHLAGEGVAEKRWTDAQKQRIVDSRLAGTRAIAEAIGAAANGPKLLVSGSAVGFYGAPGDVAVDETSPPGDDFLARLCVEWEAATAAASAAGVRVVHARTGVVQTRRGGALKRQLPLFKLGLGGRIGNGRFYVSWITLDDEVRALRFLLDSTSLSGPVNLTAPNPVTNAEYTKALGRAVHRPTVLMVPPFALSLLMGKELVQSLLASQRVVPRKLLDAGFVFRHPTIDDGLNAAVSP